MQYFNQLKIKQKILYPLLAVTILAGLSSYFYFKTLYEDTLVEGNINQARALILSAEAVREFTSEQYERKIFRDSISSQQDILMTVPIFSAMKTARSKAEELNFEFKVPKVSPRNPANKPDGYELNVLQKIKNENLSEYFEIDKETNKIRFFRPVVLTEDCMKCHGDPADSYRYWGNSDGKDITGVKMENWKAGEVHGAFEVMVDMAPIQAAVFDKSLVIAGFMVLAVILITVMVVYISNKIGVPIIELENAAQKVSEGNTEVSVKIYTEDELGSLARNFNNMVFSIQSKNDELVAEKDSIQKRVEEAVRESEAQKVYLSNSVNTMLSEMTRFADGDLTVNLQAEKDDDIGKLYNGFNIAVANIRGMITHVMDAVEATASATNQISASSEEMAAGAQEQSSQATEVAGAVEEMTSTILETSSNAINASKSAEEAGETAKESGKVIVQTVDGINDIANVVTNAAITVQKLGASSEEIGEIIQVINDIADQTNLLALNAAIEAARAGEHGRGFAVVADEVRKLAERTTKATKEIADMIKQIQNDTVEAVSSIEKGKVEAENGKGLATEAGDSLKKILLASDKVQDIISQVATASEQQSATSEEISRSIESISNVADESAVTIQQVARATEDLNQLTENLQQLIAKFNVGNNLTPLPANGNGEGHPMLLEQ